MKPMTRTNNNLLSLGQDHLEEPYGFNRWLRSGRPLATVTATNVGGYPMQVMLEWADESGKVFDCQCFTRRGTGLSQEDFEFSFKLGALVNIAPRQRWML